MKNPLPELVASKLVNKSFIDFESSKNPIDPVEIACAKGAQIGKGHKLVLINNGDPVEYNQPLFKINPS